MAVLAVLIASGDFGPPAAARALSRGQVVVAFGPELTGDPAADFSRAAGTGDTVTVYLIAGSLPAPARRFSFGLGMSRSQNLALGEIRTFDFAQVNAFVDDLAGVIRVAVNVYPHCFDLVEESIIAEVDLVRVGDEVPVQIHLGSFLYESAYPPEMEGCRGAVVFFDDSMAHSLTMKPPVPTAVVQKNWTTIKRLYRRP